MPVRLIAFVEYAAVIIGVVAMIAGAAAAVKYQVWRMERGA